MLNRRTFISACLGLSFLNAKTFKLWYLGHHGYFNTHHHSDHWFANGAIVKDGDKIEIDGEYFSIQHPK